jgi:hypothetical protein
MTATLVMIVCLATAPDICEERTPTVDGISCLMQGQLVAAQWLDEHPKWRLKGWRCRVGGGKDA